MKNKLTKKKQKLIAKIYENLYLFLEFLKEHGYKLDIIEDSEDTYCVNIKGNEIRGCAFVYKKDPLRDSKIAIDNRKCFNKIGDCPFKMKIPSPKKFEIYKKRFDFWASKQGYEISCSFDHRKYDHDGS